MALLVATGFCAVAASPGALLAREANAVTRGPEADGVTGVAGAASAPPLGDEVESAQPGGNGRDIIVYGDRIKGQVQAAQAPVTAFEEADIAAYGVSSITDLLAAIAPEINSGRGRGGSMPVILVNGQRIASFRELRDYPPESIRRVEVLPEEVALKYGYAPDQRVVNFILKKSFRSRSAELEVSAPDRGGTDTEKLQARYLRIRDTHRFNLALTAGRTSPLTDASRNLTQIAGSEPGVASDPSPAAFRTLVSRAADYSANATFTMPVGHGVAPGNLTVNAAASRADSTSLDGLNTVLLTDPSASSLVRSFPGALTRFTRTDTLQAGAALNQPVGLWQLAVTLDGTHSYIITNSANRADTAALVSAASAGTLAIDGPLPALASAGFIHAQTAADSLTSLITLIGHPVRLPAGEISFTAKAGLAWSGQSGGSTQLGIGPVAGPVPSLKRGDAQTGINLVLPITSRKEAFGAALGDITLDLSLGGNRLSDFGWLTNWSAGLTWDPTPKLNLQASFITSQSAPSFINLGDPEIYNFNQPVFDFATGNTVLTTIITGGNPNLLATREHDIKLGANWTLPFFANSNLLVEYFDNRSDNVSSAFPLLTPAIEAAFPGRVTRGGDGAIISIDERPVNLANQHESRLRWGFNLFGTIGRPLPPGSGRMGAMFAGLGGGSRPAGKGAPAGRPGPPTGGQRMGGNYPGRWNLAIYHTVQLVDRVLVAPGGPSLDLLRGDAIGQSGGVARQSVEVDGGLFYNGLGLRLGGKWSAPTHVDPIGAAASGNLRFGAMAKFNLRAFVDFDQRPGMVKQVPFLKGARLSLSANNLLDARQRVTDANGVTPLAYQPDELDPLGRVMAIELRKPF